MLVTPLHRKHVPFSSFPGFLVVHASFTCTVIEYPVNLSKRGSHLGRIIAVIVRGKVYTFAAGPEVYIGDFTTVFIEEVKTIRHLAIHAIPVVEDIFEFFVETPPVEAITVWPLKDYVFHIREIYRSRICFGHQCHECTLIGCGNDGLCQASVSYCKRFCKATKIRLTEPPVDHLCIVLVADEFKFAMGTEITETNPPTGD